MLLRCFLPYLIGTGVVHAANAPAPFALGANFNENLHTSRIWFDPQFLAAVNPPTHRAPSARLAT